MGMGWGKGHCWRGRGGFGCEWKKDDKVRKTNKCFKMSEAFGGSPNDYEEFVEKNHPMRFKELADLYSREKKVLPISEEY